MQLVAYGAQDIYLTGNPQITFFKVVYRRHTNFSMEAISQTFNGSIGDGARQTVTISRNGDLVHRMYFQATVGAHVQDNAGALQINTVELEIGGQKIDKHYGHWMETWSELTESNPSGVCATAQANLLQTGLDDGAYITKFQRMAGAGGVIAANVDMGLLFVPLQFWFCRNPGLALPLIALQYHEVKINIELRPIDECLWCVSTLGGTSASSGVTNIKETQGAYNQSLVAASLYVDYIFLDTDERRRMAQNPHEYLIEQLQFTGDESVGSSSNKIKLNFNHPCKELIWVVQPDANVDYCSSSNAHHPQHSLDYTVLSHLTTPMP